MNVRGNEWMSEWMNERSVFAFSRLFSESFWQMPKAFKHPTIHPESMFHPVTPSAPPPPSSSSLWGLHIKTDNEQPTYEAIYEIRIFPPKKNKSQKRFVERLAGRRPEATRYKEKKSITIMTSRLSYHLSSSHIMEAQVFYSSFLV